MIKNSITIDGKTTEIPIDASKLDDIELSMFFKDEDKIPLGKLAKYYLNENLNFLCGSGTSVSIDGKSINKNENPFDPIIKELKNIKKPEDYIIKLVKFFLTCGASSRRRKRRGSSGTWGSPSTPRRRS